MSTTTTAIEVPREHRNGLGIASFCTALPGAVMGLIPILAIPAVAAGLVAFGLGLAGQARVRRGTASNPVMTWLGIIGGVLAVALGVIGVVIVQRAAAQFETDLGNAGA